MVNALDLAKSVIALHHELERLGDGEVDLDLLAKFCRFRTLLLQAFCLPDITENQRLVNPPKVPNSEESRMRYLRRESRYYIRAVKKLLAQIGIQQNFDQITPEEALEWQASYVCMRLSEKESRDDASPVMLREAVLGKARRDNLPASDIFILLHAEDNVYSRFLVEVVWYGGYAKAKEIQDDMTKLYQPMIRWLLLLYRSEVPDERQLGIGHLKEAGLRFIEEFLWWTDKQSIESYLNSLDTNA